ncbi:ribose 1,5-bisphosphokinase [Eionea flava]
MDAKIFYVVGASGSGKDSILRAFQKKNIQQSLKDDNRLPIVIAHRYITRPSDNDENAIFLSEKEFISRQCYSFFAFHWQANNLHYGIGKEIDICLKAGISVIINGSRAYLETATSLYPHQLHSVLIDVPDVILEQRLKQRSRETVEAIEQRMQRHKQLKKGVMKDTAIDSLIVNDTTVDAAAKQLQSIIDRVLLIPTVSIEPEKIEENGADRMIENLE